MRNELAVALERLKQCAEEAPPFPEAVVEAVVLLDVFRGALGFTPKTSRRQVRLGAQPKSRRKIKPADGAKVKSKVKKNIEKIDILLELAKNSLIVVEVKQAGWLSKAKKLEEAVKQAARYALRLKPAQSFIIVTDGDCWVYLSIEAAGPAFRIHKLAQFSLSRDGAIARKILDRSNHATLARLFKVLLCVRHIVEEQSFQSLMNQSLPERVECLRREAEKKGVALAQPDLEIIRDLFDGTGPIMSALLKDGSIDYRPTLPATGRRRPRAVVASELGKTSSKDMKKT